MWGISAVACLTVQGRTGFSFKDHLLTSKNEVSRWSVVCDAVKAFWEWDVSLSKQIVVRSTAYTMQFLILFPTIGQWVWVHQRMVLYKSYLLLLLCFTSVHDPTCPDHFYPVGSESLEIVSESLSLEIQWRKGWFTAKLPLYCQKWDNKFF